MTRWLLFFCVFAGIANAEFVIPSESRQVVLVVSSTWDASSATVSLLSRNKDRWMEAGPKMQALTGRNGMAWGRGIHDLPANRRRKVEGDGRAPAGIFRFGTAFSKTRTSFKWPCVRLMPDHEGIDDSKSRFYNRLVRRSEVAVVDWSSSEKMHESPHYGLGIWVEHNPKREPFVGSCIYIHEWVGDRSGTAGCTVFRRADLERLLRFLDPDARPVLVQMPELVAREKVGMLFDAQSLVRKK